MPLLQKIPRLGSQRFKYIPPLPHPSVLNIASVKAGMRTHVCPLPKPMLFPQPQSATLAGISGKPMENRAKIQLTCNGNCCRAAHNCTDAVVGDALVVTRKGGVERKDSQSPLMNLDLLQVSVQSFSVMQPRDMSGHRFSRAM